MTTFEVVCAVCGDKKWPVLADRPARYVCVLCRAVTPAEGAKRRETARKAQVTRQSRLRPSGDAT